MENKSISTCVSYVTSMPTLFFTPVYNLDSSSNIPSMKSYSYIVIVTTSLYMKIQVCDDCNNFMQFKIQIIVHICDL